jgi:nucleoside triphosphate pyrophosphatase
MLVLASASPRRQELLRNAGIPFEVQPTQIAEGPLPGEGAKECAERLAREKALAVAQHHPQDVVLGADTVVVIDNEILGKPADRADAARMLRMLSGREHQVITGVCLVVGGQSLSARTGSQKGDPQGPKPAFFETFSGTAEKDAETVAGPTSAPKGAIANTRPAASLKRCPDTKLDFPAAGEAVPCPKPTFVTSSSETTTVTVSEITEDEIAAYVASGEPMDKAGAYAIQGIASRWIPRIEGDYSNVVGLPVALVWRMLRQAGGG